MWIWIKVHPQGIIGDKELSEEPKEEPKEDPKEDPKQPDVQLPVNKPNTSVQGNYNGGVGGAGTGDSTFMLFYLGLFVTSLGFVGLAIYRRQRKD